MREVRVLFHPSIVTRSKYVVPLNNIPPQPYRPLRFNVRCVLNLCLCCNLPSAGPIVLLGFP